MRNFNWDWLCVRKSLPKKRLKSGTWKRKDNRAQFVFRVSIHAAREVWEHLFKAIRNIGRYRMTLIYHARALNIAVRSNGYFSVLPDFETLSWNSVLTSRYIIICMLIYPLQIYKTHFNCAVLSTSWSVYLGSLLTNETYGSISIYVHVKI